MKHHTPFVVDQLRPEGVSGKNGGVYQLTAASVNPTRIIGRDEIGMPLEDTVPSTYHRLMVHPSGSVQKVPLRTASVPSNDPEAQRYEQIVLTELISAGWIPLDMCPYSTEYTHLTRGPFVRPKDGRVRACEGRPGGCEHMQEVIKDRLERSRQVYEASQARLSAMKTEDVERIQRATAEAFGNAIAQHFGGAPTSNIARLREGNGETDQGAHGG